jgi:phage repressor protein C with HTH and peptisase S24 domain
MLNAQVSTLIEVPKQAGAVSRRAVLVSDDSVNKVIAAGTFAIYEPISDLRTISSGKFVVIRRTQGDLEEISVRRVLSAVDGDVRLTAHSTNPAFKDTLTFNVDNDSDVQVVGLVVGKYATL